ncbi:MAG: hypothetical protein H0X26_02905 [Alphaproteobacteria bacterium]|nr:hypothetical protein [Alphaproteobacteria bacterium]
MINCLTIFIFSFSFLNSHFCQAMSVEPENLGPVAGTPSLQKSNEKDGVETYSRSFIAGKPNSNRATSWQKMTYTEEIKEGGGFFLELKELEDKESALHAYEYTLKTLREPLEQSSGVPFHAILYQAKAYGIGYIVNHYFDCTTRPEEGDLAVYPKAQYVPHTGIYREAKLGGRVESKWGWNNPFVYQHDVFFSPDYYGDLAQFYRLKPQPYTIDTVKEDIFTFTMRDDLYVEFDASEENKRIREELDNCDHPESKYPAEIQRMNYIKFFGKCYMYAFGAIFKTSDYKDHYPNLQGVECPNNERIEEYFTATREPKKGDLVCYYKQLGWPAHYGVYDSLGFVESKWGNEPVYKHPLFYVDTRYGNYIRFYRLNSAVSS